MSRAEHFIDILGGGGGEIEHFSGKNGELNLLRKQNDKVNWCLTLTAPVASRSLCKWMLLKRRTWSRERARGIERTGKWKMGTKQGCGNDVTDRGRVQVRFCSHSSFPRSPCPFPAFRFRNIPPTDSGFFQDCSEFLVLFKTDMHIFSFKYQIS